MVLVAPLTAGADLHYLDSGTAADVRRALDSKFPQEKLHGMKSLFGMAALNQHVTHLFPDVVKNVTVENMEIKKLVYMYLVRHAGDQPDLALLSVNSFQRDLSDQNPLIRALALRVMSSIRLPIIQPIVLMAVQRCAKDGSAHVRKTVATALPKLVLPPGTLSEPEEEAASHTEEEAASHTREGGLAVLLQRLGDMSPSVLTAAVFAFHELGSQQIDSLHTHYHRMVCHRPKRAPSRFEFSRPAPAGTRAA